MNGSRLPLLLLSLSLSLSCVACGGTRFSVEYTAEFSSGKMSTSVLGVFRDGQLAEEAWGVFASEMPAALHREHCDVGFGETLRTSRADMFAAIELEARSSGVNAALLSQIAPAAQGDAILTLRMYGRPALEESRAAGPRRVAHGGGSGAPTPKSDASPSYAGPSDRPLEISASLFSLTHRRTVFVMSMAYKGSSMAEAVTQFSQKLGAAIPGAFCTGWDWSAVKAFQASSTDAEH